MPRDEAANSTFFDTLTSQELFDYYKSYRSKFARENAGDYDEIFYTNLINRFTANLVRNQFFAKEDHIDIIAEFLFDVRWENEDHGTVCARLLLKSLKPLVDGNKLAEVFQEIEEDNAIEEVEVIQEGAEEDIATKAIPEESDERMRIKIIKEIKAMQKTEWEEKDEEREKKDLEEEEKMREHDFFLNKILEDLKDGGEPFKSETRPMLKPRAAKSGDKDSEQTSSSLLDKPLETTQHPNQSPEYATVAQSPQSAFNRYCRD